MASLDQLLSETKNKMSKSSDFLTSEFSKLRSGKASASLVDHISVSYYGATVTLREIASISTPEPRLIVVNAYDPSALPAIEKAIISANLGVTPMNDGHMIRIPIPELSEERRKTIIKVARQMAEKGRVAIRNIRHESNELIKEQRKKGTISEDDETNALKNIQKSTDTTTARIDTALTNKEKELLTL